MKFWKFSNDQTIYDFERMLFYSLWKNVHWNFESYEIEIEILFVLTSYETIINTLFFYNSIVLMKLQWENRRIIYLRLFWDWNEE